MDIGMVVRNHLVLSQQHEELVVPRPYLYLSFDHDLVCDLCFFFALPGFVAALLVAEQPQSLGALQFDLKLLYTETEQSHVIVVIVGFSTVLQHVFYPVLSFLSMHSLFTKLMSFITIKSCISSYALY